jgi:hypothetical protein
VKEIRSQVDKTTSDRDRDLLQERLAMPSTLICGVYEG